MTVIVGSARIDERGKARGGKAGDQTGREVSTQPWYDRWTNPWVVLRPKLAVHAEKVARCMEMACANQRIGYDQGGRDTLYSAAQAWGYDVSKVAKVVETDCSALVRVCCAYAGIAVGNFRTTTEAAMLEATGYFEKLTAWKYIHSSTFLRRGDILVTKWQGHTAVVLSDGPKAGKVYSYGERILTKGVDGPDAAQMQRYLLLLKYDLGKDGADGEFGPVTRRAVREFQRDADLIVDGSMDAADLAKLKEIALKGWPVKEPPAPPAPPVGPVYPASGLIPDTSDNQGAFYPSRIVKSCAFVVLRARVSGKADAVYKARAAAFLAASFPHWDYDYLKTRSAADAIRQADAMYNLCRPFKPIGYFLDVETLALGVTYAQSREHVRAYVTQFRARAKADGIAIKIGCYMGTSRHEKYKELDGIFDTLWPANWGDNSGFVDAVPGYGDLTQYTSKFDAKGAGYGCPGGRDMNRLTGRKPLSWFTGRQHDGSGYVPLAQATADVYVRQGPGLNYKTIAKVPKGRYVEWRDGSVTGWAAVSYQGKAGFVPVSQVKAVIEK